MILSFIPRTGFAILVTVVFGLLLAFVMMHHELWRDEAQAWMISAASQSIMDIFAYIRYEGHPPLWFIIMWPFTHFDNPNWIKMPNFLLSIAVCFLVVKHAPFPRWVLVMLVFSYFFFYEYGAISRNYQLGVLGIVGFLSFLPRAKENPWWAVFFLAIAATANVFSLIMGLVLGLYYLVQVFPKVKMGPGAKQFTIKLIAPTIALLGIVIATGAAMNPPPDQAFAPSWFWSYQPDRVDSILHMFGKVFVPIPRDIVHFWNSSVLPGAWPKYTSGILAIALFCAFIKQPKYLFWLCMFLFAIMFFQHLKYVGFLRHAGHLWVAFVVVVWLMASNIGWPSMPKLLRGLFVVLLIGQVYANAVAAVKEVTYPFSGGEAAAQFVKQGSYSNHHVVAFSDNMVSSFVAHLGKPVFFTNNKQMGTFVWWNNKRGDYNFSAYLHQHEVALRQKADETIVVSSINLGNEFSWLHPVFDSGRAITDERAWVYTIVPLP